jgi:hypothetical protein
LPPISRGIQSTDDGQYIFDRAGKLEFIQLEPLSTNYFRPFLGSEEFINGKERWRLHLDNVQPDILRKMPKVIELISNVRAFRLASKKAGTRKLADVPTRFDCGTLPTTPYLVIPKVSSERREYVPIGYLAPPTIPSDLVFVVENATMDLFGLITSRMHMAWLRFIGGRLESRYRYSIGIVYNPFPWPDADDAAKERINKLAEVVLAARLNHPTSTLADLYDPLTMPPDLRRAHTVFDLAVDRLYRKEPFETDRARVEFLLARYEQITAPTLTLAAQKPKRRKKL